MLSLSLGCGPGSQSGGPVGTGPDGQPELTDDVIRERINDGWVRDVPPEEPANREPITWSFDEDEPKEIKIVEKQIDGTRATVVLDVTTSSSKRARNQRRLAGQIRTKWELQTGWVLRRWEIVDTENISMKYRELPGPNDQNSNR